MQSPTSPCLEITHGGSVSGNAYRALDLNQADEATPSSLPRTQISRTLRAPVNDASNPARRILQTSLIATGFGTLLIAAPIARCFLTPLSYLYCVVREGSWTTARTEAELDGRVGAFYTKQSISPKESLWGKDCQLKPGERMVQYLVFGREPLDVVFDRQSRAVAVFTSYE